MPSSTWDAYGNAYLVYEGEPLAPERVRELVGDTDGILEVLEADDDSARITIWNPDGSTAELSGNGTRIAATWLAERTGAREVSIHVGPRTMVARLLADGLIEQDMGEVEVFEPEQVAGLDVTRVSVGNPHAVVAGDPATITEIGPLLETHERFPNRTNVHGPGERAADGFPAPLTWMTRAASACVPCSTGRPRTTSAPGRSARLGCLTT